MALMRREGAALTAFARLADIPEEDLWLQNQRSAHTRRAYKEDVRYFMRTFGIESREDLRRTSRAAVIAWVRKMEQEEEKPCTMCWRLSALSSLFKHLMEQHQVTDNPTDGVKRPAVGGDTGVTAAFDEAQARKILDAPKTTTLIGVRDRAILSVLLQAGPRRAEVAKMKVKDLHTNKGYPSLRYITLYKEGRQAAQRHAAFADRTTHRGVSGKSGTQGRCGRSAVSTGSHELEEDGRGHAPFS